MASVSQWHSVLWEAAGQVNRSASCGLALTSYSADTSQNTHPATAWSFFVDRESEFPHHGVLDKLAGLEGTFDFCHINLFLPPLRPRPLGVQNWTKFWEKKT